MLRWPHTPQAFLETSPPSRPLPSAGKNRTATTPGTSSPTLLEQCVGSLTSHGELMNIEGICETGPMVYSPYPIRLESLSTFSGLRVRR